MNKRLQKRVAGGAALLLVVLVVSLVAVWKRPVRTPGVTQENFQRLHKGLSQQQVEAILGSEGETLLTGLFTLKRYEGTDCRVDVMYWDDSATRGRLYLHDEAVEEGDASTGGQWLPDKPPTFLESV